MTKKPAEHSPLCWIDKTRPGIIRFADALDEMDGLLAGRRANLIVRRVNKGPAFDMMVTALHECLSQLRYMKANETDAYRQALAALRLAKSSSPNVRKEGV